MTALVREAGRQGLLGLLARAVVGTPGGRSWPDTIQEQLRSSARSLVVRGQRQLELATDVERRLSESGGRVLPLKGIALVDWLYASPAERPMADIDLLVLGDLDAASRALRADGFLMVERADHADALKDPRSGLVVELHRSVTSCPGLFPLDVEGLWSRRHPAASGLISRPSAADLLVMLSLHAAFQHGLVLSLVQWLDFRLLLEQAAPAVGDVVAAAAFARAEDAVTVALAGAEAAVGALVPPGLAERFRPRRRGLSRWTAALTANPGSLLPPAQPELTRARLALAHGRRAELIWRSLDGTPPDEGGSDRTPSLRHRLARAARLLRRAGLELGRS